MQTTFGEKKLALSLSLYCDKSSYRLKRQENITSPTWQEKYLNAGLHKAHTRYHMHKANTNNDQQRLYIGTALPVALQNKMKETTSTTFYIVFILTYTQVLLKHLKQFNPQMNHDFNHI